MVIIPTDKTHLTYIQNETAGGNSSLKEQTLCPGQYTEARHSVDNEAAVDSTQDLEYPLPNSSEMLSFCYVGVFICFIFSFLSFAFICFIFSYVFICFIASELLVSKLQEFNLLLKTTLEIIIRNIISLVRILMKEKYGSL